MNDYKYIENGLNLVGKGIAWAGFWIFLGMVFG